jgi:hypothetical protein
MTANVTQPNSSPNQTQSVVEQLVGPGKKFDSVESALKGKVEADAFIASLTSEAAQLRQALAEAEAEKARLSARASILDRLNQPNEAPGTSPVQQQTPNPAPGPKALSDEDVVAVIRRTDQQKAAEANLKRVDDTLVKTFGVDAVAVVRQRASELGLPVDDLMQVGARSPEALFNMIGVQKTAEPGNPMYQSKGFSTPGQGVEIRNKAYYDKRRAEMGNIKFLSDKKIMLDMHKDAQALGDAFYS